MTRWLLHHWHSFWADYWFRRMGSCFLCTYYGYSRAYQKYRHHLQKLTP